MRRYSSLRVSPRPAALITDYVKAAGVYGTDRARGPVFAPEDFKLFSDVPLGARRVRGLRQSLEEPVGRINSCLLLQAKRLIALVECPTQRQSKYGVPDTAAKRFVGGAVAS